MASTSVQCGKRRQKVRRAPGDKEFFRNTGPFREWKDSSPTFRILSANAERLSLSVDTVKKGLQNAQQSSTDAKAKLLRYIQWKAAAAQQQAAAARAQAQAVPASPPDAAEVNKILREVGSKRESKLYAAGTLLFGGLLFIAGAQPWLLPWVFVAFLVVALPWRAYHFHQHKWDFFMMDFCYWANLAALAFILFFPQNTHLGAAIYALADGPLAAALIAWQSAWVFNSAPHAISVLMHLLPGLAMFAQKHFREPPLVVKQLARRLLGAVGQNAPVKALPPRASAFTSRFSPGSFFWLFVMPMVFYLSWQLVYFVVVQVVCRSFILRNGYDTSYTTLARRAAKTNNFWNRLVRKGSIARRVFLYGLIQAIYTAGVLLCFFPIYHSFYLATIWQIVKVAFPIYYGSRFQCEKVPRHTAMRVLKMQRVQAGWVAPAAAA